LFCCLSIPQLPVLFIPWLSVAGKYIIFYSILFNDNDQAYVDGLFTTLYAGHKGLAN
jgi:hypothetical protein